MCRSFKSIKKLIYVKREFDVQELNVSEVKWYRTGKYYIIVLPPPPILVLALRERFA